MSAYGGQYHFRGVGCPDRECTGTLDITEAQLFQHIAPAPAPWSPLLAVDGWGLQGKFACRRCGAAGTLIIPVLPHPPERVRFR